MNKQVSKMIDTTVENLMRAKETGDDQLMQAVLVNLNSVLPSYIQALDNE